jgi:penicillin amidase
MRKFILLMLCLLLIFGCSIALGGCAPEETGAGDWLKWYFNQDSGLPVYEGTVAIDGLDSPVEIYFDDYAVAHIIANSEADLMFAQGYIHAMERIFQMDLTRRAIAGRLAEIVGSDYAEDDVFSRTIGFRRAAQRSLEALQKDYKECIALLDSYTAGVNEYIEQNRDNLPPEFILLDYEPEPWEPLDSLSIAKMMAWALGGNMETELFLAALAEEVGPEMAAELFPAYADYGPSIMERAEQIIDGDAAARLLRLTDLAGLAPRGRSIGSNNWVVAPGRSASGGALLSNDMHLTLDLPPIWYANYLSAPGYSVTGVIFPGIPGVIAGFNDHIAWGETNVNPDVMDLYEIKFDETDDTRYLYNDEWHRAQVYDEVVKVRGGEDIELRIRETEHHGPVISDLVELERPLALRWTGLDATLEAEAMRLMIRATNFEEFRAALTNFMAPAQNFVYADVEGNIGYLANGLYPIRSESHDEAGNGLLPVPGWTDEYAWQGFVPWEEIPVLYNPPAGLIVTANHKVVDDDYPYHLTYEWVPPGRALSILGELEGRSDLTVEDMMDVQGCFHNQHAGMMVPVLLERLAGADLDESEAAALEALEHYGADPVDAADSAGAAIYHTLYPLIGKMIFEPHVSEELLPRFFGYNSILDLLDRILLTGETSWTDDLNGAVRQAFSEAVSTLKERLGSTVTEWQWGDIHTLTFKHYLGDDVSKKKYNRGPFAVGGSYSTPGMMGFSPRPELPYEVYGGAPWRYAIDMSDHSARHVLAIGNSGHLKSSHYDDMLEIWLGFEHRPRLFDPEEIRSLERRLLLQPAR